jgi:hypothetical protein
MKSRTILPVIIIFIAAAAAWGQEGPSTSEPAASGPEETRERIAQMEVQLKELQRQVDALKAAMLPAKQPEAEPTPNALTPLPATAKAETVPAAAQPKQTGVDLGHARLTPYGSIYFNAFGNTGGTNNADVPLFATSTGASHASASVRQTRLGIRLQDARVGNAKLNAVLEADFFGGFPTMGLGENFGVVRIRLANARLDWERTSVTIGQDWMPLAPLNPTSIAAAAIPQMAAAGNNWARIPQVRAEHRFAGGITIVGAVLSPQTGDHPAGSSFFLQPNGGAASSVPFVQSRAAYGRNNWFGSGKPGSIAVAGHYGRSRVAGEYLDSAGVAADWSMPLHSRFVLTGEAFFGRNLAGFQGGIFQGTNPDFAYRTGAIITPGGPRSIGSRGGWMQASFTPAVFANRWSLHASAGIDDPNDGDLTSISRTNYRTRNLAFAANTIYRLTPQFWLGAEFRHFRTSYLNTVQRTASHLNLGAVYSF